MQKLPEWLKIKQCKKILTKDLSNRENGFLIDILNRHDPIFAGRQDELFQQVYYSSVYKGMFKGFHIHPAKYDTVTWILGRALLIFYPEEITRHELDRRIAPEDLIMVPFGAERDILTVSFPSKFPHGYYGLSEVAYILNYRNPAWHPADNMQYDYKLDGIEDFLADWAVKHEES